MVGDIEANSDNSGIPCAYVRAGSSDAMDGNNFRAGIKGDR
jgi:hypothetical protein